MAERKKLDVGPHLAGGVGGYVVKSTKLDDRGFGTIVRLIKNGRVAQVEQLKVSLGVHMGRLRLRSRGVEPVAGVPGGSDQVDIGSIIGWANGITRQDAEAKAQLVQIMATINARLS